MYIGLGIRNPTLDPSKELRPAIEKSFFPGFFYRPGRS
jgi:hypothetical protein